MSQDGPIKPCVANPISSSQCEKRKKKKDDRDADLSFERCQGMVFPDVFMGDSTDDDGDHDVAKVLKVES
jgi:hypothetical protein